MQKIKSKQIYNNKLQRTIYIIFHPYCPEIFIDFTLEKRLRETYKEHYNLRIASTRKMFEEFRYTATTPKMFALESGKFTIAEAYQLKIIWVRIFLELGYESIETGEILNQAQEIYEENILKYLERKKIKIAELCSEDKRLYPNYGREKRRLLSVENEQIHLRIKKEEKECIQNIAKLCGMTVTAYMKNSALNTSPIIINRDVVLQHTDEISKLKQQINLFIETVVDSGQCASIDIENVILLLEEIVKLENTFLSEIRREEERIKRYVKKIINENIKKMKNEAK